MPRLCQCWCRLTSYEKTINANHDPQCTLHSLCLWVCWQLYIWISSIGSAWRDLHTGHCQRPQFSLGWWVLTGGDGQHGPGLILLEQCRMVMRGEDEVRTIMPMNPRRMKTWVALYINRHVRRPPQRLSAYERPLSSPRHQDSARY
jgi:hypothetical protein